MKTHIGNVTLLDLRNATPESVAQIERIDNAVLAIVSPDTRALLQRMSIGNLVMTAEVPKDVNFASHNGEFTLEEARDGKAVYLLVNGTLTIAPTMTPDAMQRTLAGGHVNGVVYGNQQQIAALSAIGVSVNGKSIVYPDSAKLRTDKAPLTEAEARAMDMTPYLTRCVRVEAGAVAALAEKGLHIDGQRGAIIDEAQREAFYRLWDGKGQVILLPDGYTLMDGSRTIGRRDAPLLRGKRLVRGNLYLREDVTGEALAALEALTVTGTLFLPVSLLDAVLGKLASEPELVPYEGTLLAFDGAHHLEADVSLLPEKVAICCDGVLQLDPGIDPAALKERVTMLYVDGVAQMTPAQQMALLPVITGDGQIETETLTEDEADGPHRDDVHYIRNVVQYVV